MIQTLIAAIVGLLIGVGLNRAATWLPQYRRDEQEEYGLYFRFVGRNVVLPALHALLYGWIWWRFGADWRVAGPILIYSTIFLLVAVIDLETRLIPNILILPAIAIALAGSAIDPRLTMRSSLIGGVVGFLLFYLIALLARGGFGAGDVKLSAFIGAVAGFPSVLVGLAAGIIVGGVAAVVLLVTRRATRQTYMPYGPFLCIGGWYAMLWGNQVFWSQFG